MNQERARTWAVGLGLLLLGTLGAWALGREAADLLLLPATLTRENRPEVPDLVGEELEEARRRAEGAGTALDVLGIAYGDDVDSGEVLVQFPPEGFALEEGRPIEVLVGAGPGRRRIPDLAGLPEASARALLRQAGIPVRGLREVEESGFERGVVAASEPPAGAPLAPDDSVVLAISRGSATVEVPSVIGMPAAEAAATLERAQLRAGEATSAQGDREEGAEAVVVEQDPPAGGLARAGSPVALRLGRPRDVPRQPSPAPAGAREQAPRRP